MHSEVRQPRPPLAALTSCLWCCKMWRAVATQGGVLVTARWLAVPFTLFLRRTFLCTASSLRPSFPHRARRHRGCWSRWTPRWPSPTHSAHWSAAAPRWLGPCPFSSSTFRPSLLVRLSTPSITAVRRGRTLMPALFATTARATIRTFPGPSTCHAHHSASFRLVGEDAAAPSHCTKPSLPHVSSP